MPPGAGCHWDLVSLGSGASPGCGCDIGVKVCGGTESHRGVWRGLSRGQSETGEDEVVTMVCWCLSRGDLGLGMSQPQQHFWEGCLFLSEPDLCIRWGFG